MKGLNLNLQNLRNASELSRERALDRATNRSNTFAEARIAEEERVAKAAEEAAEAKIKADEAATDAAIKLAEEQSEANQKHLTKQLRRSVKPLRQP